MTLVYKFGLLPPTENRDLVFKELSRGNWYYNKLIEIEREYRKSYRTICQGSNECVVRAAERDASVRGVLDEISEWRKVNRSTKTPKELASKLKVAKEAKKEALQELRDSRKLLREDPSAVARMKALGDQVIVARKEAYKAPEAPFWGTSLPIQRAVEQACKTTPMWDGADPKDPKFRRNTGSGNIAVQLQAERTEEGLVYTTTEDLFTGKSQYAQLSLDNKMVPGGLTPGSRRSMKRQYGTISLRVGTVPGKTTPIWAKWPIILHRELPPGAEIKWVTVNRKMIGPHEEWTCCITVDNVKQTRSAPLAEGSVGIDVGWRKFPGGTLSVATWKGSDGKTGRVLLSERMLGGFQKANDLREIRDKSFNEARAGLISMMADLSSPGWLQEQTKTLDRWKSPARLARLANSWAKQRFNGDQAAYEALEKWRYNDFHLWAWETNQRVKSVRGRKDFYQTVALDLSSRYKTLVIEDLDMRDLSKRNVDKGELNETARGNRFIASVGQLRDLMRRSFAEVGGKVVEVPSEWTTKRCFSCKQIDTKWENPGEQVHVCGHCGALWDRDENAPLNILESESRGADRTPSRARTTLNSSEPATLRESMWARNKRLKREKAGIDKPLEIQPTGC